MSNLLSPGVAFAGQWGPNAILTATGLPVTNTPISVYQSDGTTTATLYTDQTRATTTANPVNTDGYGNLTFWTNPGIYVLSFNVGGVLTTDTVEVKPWYTDSAWNVRPLSASGGNATALSGDSVLMDASGAAATVVLPSPSLGERVLVTKTDSSANIVSLTTPSGVINGPTGLSGAGTATISFQGQGQSVQVQADGTNWNVVGALSSGAVSLTNASSFITATVAVSSSTPVNVTSLSLTAGTWFITGQCYATGAASYVLDAFIGPTSASSTGTYTSASQFASNPVSGVYGASVACSAVVTLTATTTVYLEASSPVSQAFTVMTASDGGVANATGLVAVRIA